MDQNSLDQNSNGPMDQNILPGCLLFIVSKTTFLASFNPLCGPMHETVLPCTLM